MDISALIKKGVSTVNAQQPERIYSIDGFRGIAIFLVLLFHYCSRWSSEYSQPLYPYGDKFANLIGARDGFVGVYLFFIVSGFVIFSTLRRCPTILIFWLKRADRLLPPMLFLSALTFLLLSSILETPYLDVQPVDFIPSWTFTAPAFWTWIDPNIRYIDGVYWTLFVEVRFYIIISVIWYGVSRVNAVLFITIYSYLGVAFFLVASHFGLETISKVVSIIFMPQYFSFFASGVYYYKIWSGSRKYINYVGLTSLVLIGYVVVNEPNSFHREHMSVYAWVSFFHVAFLLVSFRTSVARVFSFSPFVALGTISYSFYLFHQGVGVALIHRMMFSDSCIMLAVQMLLIVLFVGLVSALSWKYIESKKLVSVAVEKIRGH